MLHTGPARAVARELLARHAALLVSASQLAHPGTEAGVMPARASHQPGSRCTSASEQLRAELLLGG
jgi:hypothetical protein